MKKKDKKRQKQKRKASLESIKAAQYAIADEKSQWKKRVLEVPKLPHFKTSERTWKSQVVA